MRTEKSQVTAQNFWMQPGSLSPRNPSSSDVPCSPGAPFKANFPSSARDLRGQVPGTEGTTSRPRAGRTGKWPAFPPHGKCFTLGIADWPAGRLRPFPGPSLLSCGCLPHKQGQAPHQWSAAVFGVPWRLYREAAPRSFASIGCTAMQLWLLGLTPRL